MTNQISLDERLIKTLERIADAIEAYNVRQWYNIPMPMSPAEPFTWKPTEPTYYVESTLDGSIQKLPG